MHAWLCHGLWALHTLLALMVQILDKKLKVWVTTADIWQLKFSIHLVTCDSKALLSSPTRAILSLLSYTWPCRRSKRKLQWGWWWSPCSSARCRISASSFFHIDGTDVLRTTLCLLDTFVCFQSPSVLLNTVGQYIFKATIVVLSRHILSTPSKR